MRFGKFYKVRRPSFLAQAIELHIMTLGRVQVPYHKEGGNKGLSLGLNQQCLLDLRTLYAQGQTIAYSVPPGIIPFCGKLLPLIGLPERSRVDNDLWLNSTNRAPDFLKLREVQLLAVKRDDFAKPRHSWVRSAPT